MAIVGKKKDGTNINIDDKKQRVKIIDFFKLAYGWNLINGKTGKIDLLFENDTSGKGIEIEEAQVHGDYWSSPNFGYNSFLRDGNPPFPYQTLNIPPRKHHFWMNGRHNNIKGKFWYEEFNENNNIFVRSNIEVTQVMVVMPDIINDFKTRKPTKVVISTKQAKRIYDTNGPELFIGVKKEYVNTWDLISNVWTLRK